MRHFIHSQKYNRLRYLFVLIIFSFFITPNTVHAQGDVGVFLGLSNYQGDLASYNFEEGINIKLGPVLGLHAGYELNKRFQLRADLQYARISGTDALQVKETNRSRNLDFFAPVIQLAVGIDWNMLGFNTNLPGSFTPYAAVGASVFYFNPKTKYQGEKVSLQPLGTEGQFLEDYPDQKPYSRIQTSLQFGGGLKYRMQRNIIIALEGMLSFTFTDYLDDVSTIYISYPELLDKAGPLTAALANRQGEYLGTDPVIAPTGSARANPESNDLFGVMTFRISIPIKVGSEKFRIRRHNNKTIQNPKF